MVNYFPGMASEILYMNCKKAIVFFDGDCPLCHWAVQFILKHEKSNFLIFSPLKSESTRIWLDANSEFQFNEDTLYFFDGNTLYKKSSAVLKLVAYLRPIFLFLNLVYLFPKPLRDYLYDKVAENRRKAKGSCDISKIDPSRIL